MRTTMILLLLGLWGASCDPGEEDPGRNFSLSVYAGSDIVISRGLPEEEASLLVSGLVQYFEDISDMVLEPAQVSLTADGVEVASGACPATFREAPTGDTGQAGFDIQCAFTNAQVDALCDAGQAGIQVDVHTNLGGHQSPEESLEVQCFADRRRPDIMALTSEGAPAGKICRLHDGGSFELRFGYADGLISFEDEYDDDEFLGRVAYFYDAAGHLTESVSVDAEGLWYLKKTYTYQGAILASVTSEFYPDQPGTCSYAFEDGDTTWTIDCDTSTRTTYWDPAAKTLIYEKEGVELTLTYAGTLDGPTQWYAVPLRNYINDFHPVDEVGQYNDQDIVTTYTYDADDLLVGANSSMGDQLVGTFFYEYNCR